MTRGTGAPSQLLEKTLEPAKSSTQKIPIIDQSICRGCMICARHCPEGAFEKVNGFAVINPEVCTNCRNCVASCPLEAIN